MTFFGIQSRGDLHEFLVRLAHIPTAVLGPEEERNGDRYRVHQEQKHHEREDAVEQQFVEHILVQVLLVEPAGKRQHQAEHKANRIRSGHFRLFGTMMDSDDRCRLGELHC